MSKKSVQDYLQNIKAETIFDDRKSFEILVRGDIIKTMSDRDY